MKYLVVMLWPAGIAAILVAAAMLSRRPVRPSALRRLAERVPAPHVGAAGGLPEPVKLTGVAIAGWAAAFAIMLGLGAVWVVHHGSSIDRPIYSFTVRHRIADWTSAATQLTKIADIRECLVVAVAAAVCLTAGWHRRKWVPPVVLATTVVADHYVTLALRGVFERLGPPNSPGGTYPSGGCERAILYFGLIAYLFWREFSGRRKVGIWAAAAVACLAFNEVYTRTYLTLHWFTDAFSGSIYGALLLATAILAVRTVAGPATARDRNRATASGATA